MQMIEFGQDLVDLNSIIHLCVLKNRNKRERTIEGMRILRLYNVMQCVTRLQLRNVTMAQFLFIF